MSQPPIPVTVLTGFLGSGKTTLLNRILTENHGKKIAVIENEFGEIGIDHDLVVNADEELFEMNNGCICCTVRGDLIRVLSRLMRRKERLDAILIETTGLADPGPVTQTFFVDDEIKTRLSLDAIVTLVDAKHVLQHLDTDRECKEQIGFADVLLLNKTDLVSPAEADAVEKRIRAINGVATIYRTHNAEIALDKILDVRAFDLNQKLNYDPAFLEEDHDHSHDETVQSVGLRSDRPLDMKKFEAWLSEFLKTKGPDIFRMKGILHLKDQDRRFVFQGVHMLFDGRPDRPWGEEKRENRLIFIGRNLDRAALTHAFSECLS
jgi:G3E family GTPase